MGTFFKTGFGIPLILAMSCLGIVLQNEFWGFASSFVEDHLAAHFGIEKAKMMGDISAYVIIWIPAIGSIALAFWLGRKYRKMYPSQLTVEFNQSEPGNTSRVRFESGQVGIFFRLLIKPPKNEIRHNCRGTLVEIKRPEKGATGLETIWNEDRLPLTWARQGGGAEASIDLNDPHGRFLDVFFITEENFIGASTVDRYPLTSAIGSRTSGPKRFIFYISISDDESKPKTYELEFTWSKDWYDYSARLLN